MQAHYRKDYTGEFVITETKWSGGRKQQTREWIPNSIENHHISGRAVCIGSDIDKDKFDYTILTRHRGGLLGSKKLQTYGVGDIAHDMRLDFAIETDNVKLEKLIEKNYHHNNIVYSTPRNCVHYRESLYLIPYNPVMTPHGLAVYLSAFDGHQEIFLLGYNQYTNNVGNTSWHVHVANIMQSYANTKFYIVGSKIHAYDHWLALPNVESMTYRDFITYCDV
jgi:hypothetical protein